MSEADISNKKIYKIRQTANLFGLWQYKYFLLSGVRIITVEESSRICNCACKSSKEFNLKFKFAILVSALFILPVSSMASEFCLIMESSGPEDSSYFYDGVCTDGKTFRSESISGLNPFYHDARMKSVLNKLLSKTTTQGYKVLNDLSGKISQSGQQIVVIAKGTDSNSQICATRSLQLESCTKNVTSLPFSHDLVKSKTIDANSVLVENSFKKAGTTRLRFFDLVFFER